jgi:putative salt-induced outer membrane protein YdiY
MERAVHFFCFFCLLFLLPFTLFADQVTLTNGDRLTGEIVKSDGKTLTLKTPFAGTVEIQWSAIQDLHSDKPEFVQSRHTKQTYSGRISLQGDSVIVKPESGNSTTLAKADIAALRSPAEQAAFEKQQHPGLLQGWNGGANVGFALTGGNSETTNLSLAFNAVRTGLHDKLALSESSVYATNALSSPTTTANLIQGAARYDHDFDGIMFVFGGADFMSDALQALNLRSVFSGGLGYHIIKRDTTTLDFISGVNYTRENYVPFSRNSAGLTLGEAYMHKMKHSTVVTQDLTFFPDLSDAGQYRATFDLGTTTKLSKWFGWQNTFSDIYVTNPPLGARMNDVLFSTGMNVSFTH